MSVNETIAKLNTIKELQRMIEEATAEMEAIKDEIKASMSAQNTDEMTVGVYKVTYKAVKSSRLDTTAFKRDHAELYSAYSKTAETRRFVIA